MLELSNINTGYGGASVLKDVSFTLEHGSITALMGRNGMGKTTLLHTIVGRLKSSGGFIKYRTKELHRLAAYLIAREGIALVPQGREVFDNFTVLENLHLGSLGHGSLDPLRLQQVFEWFPVLEERQDQKAGTFSGGQQQMLAIGRALMSSPTLLLLDEPTEGIQPSVVHEIGVTLQRIAEEMGLTILVVEQNVDLVLTMSREVLFLENGQIVDQCATSSLIKNDSLLHRYLSI